MSDRYADVRVSIDDEDSFVITLLNPAGEPGALWDDALYADEVGESIRRAIDAGAQESPS